MGVRNSFYTWDFCLTIMQLDGQFIAGISLTVFGLLLILLGVLVNMMNIFLPVALVFIFGGIALKVISVKNLS